MSRAVRRVLLAGVLVLPACKVNEPPEMHLVLGGSFELLDQERD